jgi:hypothetical protein
MAVVQSVVFYLKPSGNLKFSADLKHAEWKKISVENSICMGKIDRGE